MKPALLVALLSLVPLFAVAQQPPASLPTGGAVDKGLYSNMTFGIGRDNSVGWSSETDYALGYDVNRHFSVEMGIPVWLVATTQATSATGATNQTETGVLGDFFLRLTVDPKPTHFGYHMNLTGTAPTGDTSLGLSTGRAGVLWGNHLEKDLGPVTPFGEFALSNSQWPTQQFQRSYTVLGKSTAFRGGAQVDLPLKFGIEGSVYDVAPFGTQKVYSRVVAHGMGAGLTKVHKGRPYASQAVTVGDASIAADHGFSAGVSFDPTKRVNVSLDYNHSIVQSLDSVGISVAYRFGHLAGERPRRSQ